MRQTTIRDQSRGFLDFPRGQDFFGLQRLTPAIDLQPWIDGYWIVSWDVPPGRVHRQTNIAHASIKAVIEPEGRFLYGIPRRTIVRPISGNGSVLGVVFRPGGFFPFWGSPLSELTGERVDLDEAFGTAAAAWAHEMETVCTAEEKSSITDAFLRKLRDKARSALFSDRPSMATLLAERIISDCSIVTVAAAAAAAGMEVRSLQRLFHREVGIAPKEVIRRFRLQEAAERLLRDPSVRCDAIALDLGYFDQSHFTRDFKSVVGVAPETYRRRQQGSPDRASADGSLSSHPPDHCDSLR